VLAIPRLGCINIHASLLPRWRGAAPVHRAILAGDERTGVCIMAMEAGLDTGPVILARQTAITAQDTTGTLTERLAALGAAAIVEALVQATQWRPVPQDDRAATYAAKVAKEEARLDWSQSNVEIDRRIRAFNPAPGAEAALGEETVKIWAARPVAGAGAPGSILPSPADILVVACGDGALQITELQRPGGRRILAADFLRGREFASR
jgi:methionyl-tRNA formyltransferase